MKARFVSLALCVLKGADLAPNVGYAHFSFNPINYVTKDRFTGITALQFGLLDGKVATIGLSYSNAPEFDRPAQLVEIITRQFGLPDLKDWPGYNEH
jgi:hypothetical protein